MYTFYDVFYSECGRHLRGRCYIDNGHEFFKGHFESQSLMPAAAQLQMVDAFIQFLDAVEMSILGGRNIKFAQSIFPDEVIELRLFRKTDSWLELTLLKTDESIATKGTLNVKGQWND